MCKLYEAETAHEDYEEQNWFSKGSCYMGDKVWKKWQIVVVFSLQNVAPGLGWKYGKPKRNDLAGSNFF